MRLIDADALKNSVLKWLPLDPCGQDEKEYPFETDICVSMMQEIEDAPTIEPEPEIIACEDCKHWVCHDRRCGYWNHGVKPLDWCSYAERRTDE